MTLKELIDMFEDHNTVIGSFNLVFYDHNETWSYRDLFWTGRDRLNFPVRIWKYDSFDEETEAVTLTVHIKET